MRTRQESNITRRRPHALPARMKKAALAVLLAFAALLIFFVLYGLTIASQSPKIDPDNIYKTLSQSTILYADNGQVIDHVYQKDGNRINVSYNDIPDNLIDAVVATEDKTFWHHHGFNVIRMLGAIKESFLGGGDIRGTSTITQQLARNVYLPDTKSQRSLRRKIAEAWYTLILERRLTKQQIMEAYLNTVYLGCNAYGVQAASQAYFSKDVENLDLTECAALAAILKSPSTYALVTRLDSRTTESTALELKHKDVLRVSSDYTIVYNGDASAQRRALILQNMRDQGYITKAEYKAASAESLRSDIDISGADQDTSASYMSAYVLDQVQKDLESKGYSAAVARKMIYTGGLRIQTTLDQNVQHTLSETFEKDSLFPAASATSHDAYGNITGSDGGIVLYRYDNLVDENSRLTLQRKDWRQNENGDIVIAKGGPLHFAHNGKKIDITVRKMYLQEAGTFYTIADTALLIPAKYSHLEKDGSLRIDHAYREDYPENLTTYGDQLLFSRHAYTLGQKTQQPQGAMVIIDYRTGQIKAMCGGRGTTGRFLYNRAASPRQPGSAIKPLAVYSTALQQGAEAAKANAPMEFTAQDKNERTSLYGSYWTAASRINDAPLTINGRVWPKNWYQGYRGLMTMRQSVEQSVNTSAVRVFRQIGSADAIRQLEAFGITSVKSDGDPNDQNAAALALGGMTSGISPVEMASAYGTFPNRGVHNAVRCYTQVKNRDGTILLQTETEGNKVMDESVAFIMRDILRTTVTRGVAREASIPGAVVAGKTGTTSENRDAWFCGFAGTYAAACWIGSDMVLELNEGSTAACRLWRAAMEKLDLSGSLPSMPASVIRTGGEYYVKGTEPMHSKDQFSEEKAKEKSRELSLNDLDQILSGQ